MSGAASTGTVAMNFAAVNGAGEAMVTTSNAMNASMSNLSHCLDPVRQTWYQSGSQSGADAQIAESKLRQAINDISQIVHQLGTMVKQSSVDGHALDQHLAGTFASQGATSTAQGLY